MGVWFEGRGPFAVFLHRAKDDKSAPSPRRLYFMSHTPSIADFSAGEHKGHKLSFLMDVVLWGKSDDCPETSHSPALKITHIQNIRDILSAFYPLCSHRLYIVGMFS